MALVDVSDLLLDPDFVDAVTLIHRTSTVNTYGENVLMETPVSTIGCVQPASGKTVMRLPEALRLKNIYSFWIKAQIVTDGSGVYPDIISFQGQRYAVQNVLDYGNWKPGWTEGIAVREIMAL